MACEPSGSKVQGVGRLQIESGYMMLYARLLSVNRFNLWCVNQCSLADRPMGFLVDCVIGTSTYQFIFRCHTEPAQARLPLTLLVCGVCVYMYVYIYECVRLWVYVSIHVNCNCGNVMQQNQIGPNPIMSFLRHGPMSPWSLPNLAARDGTRPA